MKRNLFKAMALAMAIGAGFTAFAQEAPPPPPSGIAGGGDQGGPPPQFGGQGQFGRGMARGPMRGPMMGPMLLMIPKVQQELHMTQDQVKKAREAFPPPPGMRRGGPGGTRGFGGGPGGPGGPPPGGQDGFGGGPGGPPPGGPGGGPGGGPDDGPGGPPPGGPGGPGFGGQGGPGGPGFGPGGQGGPGGPQDAVMTKLQDKKLHAFLDDTQFTRFKQIELQVEGPRALIRPEVDKDLGLTGEQRQKIGEILRQNRPPMGPGGPGAGGQGGPGGPGFGGPGGPGGPDGGPGGPPPDDRGGPGGPGGPGGQGRPGGPQAEAHRKMVMDKLVAVLTADQKEKWRHMVGKPFDLHP